MVYKRNRNLQEVIGVHTIKNGNVFKAHPREGKCEPCNTSKPSLWCKQVIDTSTFQSYLTHQLFTVFHKVNSKSKFMIYLIGMHIIHTLFKIQYVGKAETAFNRRLNNHMEDVNPADLHFRKWALIQSSCKIQINQTSK